MTDDSQQNTPVTDDPAVSQVVSDALAINQTLNQPVNDSPAPGSDDAETVVFDQSDSKPSSDSPGKSPLDILEEILQKEKGSSTPAVPEKSPEEIASEEATRKAEHEAMIEAQRQKLIQEVQTPEQQKRDTLRHQQAQNLNVKDKLHIPQLSHKKIWVEENQ